MFQRFVDALAQALPESLNILVLDNSGAHTSQRLTLLENVQLVFWPPDCPALSPIERVWRDVKDEVARQQCTDLEAQEESLSTLLRAYEVATLQSLTGYPYLIETIYALCISRSNMRHQSCHVDPETCLCRGVGLVFLGCMMALYAASVWLMKASWKEARPSREHLFRSERLMNLLEIHIESCIP